VRITGQVSFNKGKARTNFRPDSLRPAQHKIELKTA
jgi:hypothetical protein